MWVRFLARSCHPAWHSVFVVELWGIGSTNNSWVQYWYLRLWIKCGGQISRPSGCNHWDFKLKSAMIFIFLSFLFPLRMNIFPLRPHSASSLNVSVRRSNQISAAVLADSDYEILVCSGLFPAALQNTTQAAVVSRSQAPVPH